MKKRLLSLLCILLAVFMTVGVFSSCKKKPAGPKTPEEYLDKITDKNFAGNYESVNTRTDVTVKPTADLPLPFDSLSLTEYYGTEGESVVFAKAVLDGQPLDVSLYVGGESAIVGSSLIGDTTIGLRYQDLGTFVEGILGSYGGYTTYDNDDYYDDWDDDYYDDWDDDYYDDPFGLGMSEEDLLELLTLLSSAELTEVAEELAKYIEEYATFISDSFESASESEVKNENGMIYVTSEFDSDSAKKFIKDVYDKIKKDTDFKKFIAETLAPVAGMEESEILDQINALFEGDELYDEIINAMDEIDFSIKTTVISKSDYTLTGFEFELEIEDLGRIIYEINVPDDKNASFLIQVDDYDPDTRKFETSAKLGVNLKTKVSGDVSTSTLSFDLVSEEDDLKQKFDLITYTYNSKSGEYSLKITNPEDSDEAVTLGGVSKTKGNTTTTTLTYISYLGEKVAIDVTVTVETNVTLPKFPTNFKSVFELTEADLEELAATIEANPLFPQLVSLIEELGDYGYDDDYYEDWDDDYYDDDYWY